MYEQQWWPPEVQAQAERLFIVENVDVWVFRSKSTGLYFAVGGLDTLAITTLLASANVVKFTSQRMKDIKYDRYRGVFYRVK